jgi:phage-related tail protein
MLGRTHHINFVSVFSEVAKKQLEQLVTQFDSLEQELDTAQKNLVKKDYEVDDLQATIDEIKPRLERTTNRLSKIEAQTKQMQLSYEWVDKELKKT